MTVEASAKTFTLSGDGKSYVFHVTPGTRIGWHRGALKFSDLKAGQEAEVEMILGPGGEGRATVVRLSSPWTATFTGPKQGLSSAMAESVWAATTPRGRRLSAGEIKPLVTEILAPQRYLLERLLCFDKTAAGGNATLLAASEGAGKLSVPAS